MKKNIIEIQNLSQKFGDFTAVDTLSLSISEGEVFGFLGHNGAGKTTTINMLTTLSTPSSGTANIAGFDLVKEPFEIKKIIGYVPENVELYQSFTAYENLEYFAKLSGIQKPKQIIDETLGFLGSASYAHKKTKDLSKGMRQRIGIAQAILHNPKILFLDEPTSGLDPMGMKQLRDIISDLNTKKGMTIFMNTHLLSEVTKTCTSIGVLNHGKLIYHDSLEKVLQKFKNQNSLEDIYLGITKNND